MIIEELLQGELVPYVATFLVFFAVLFFAINRSIFRENRTVGAIIAASISLLIVWYMKNYTDSFYSIENILYDLQGSYQLLVFGLIGFLVLVLIYRGAQKTGSELKFPLLLFGLAGLGILMFFLPDIVSYYYLPEWIFEFRYIFLIAGIAVGILGIFKTKKQNFWDKLKKEFKN